jgi:hypothetical protein
LYIYVRPFIHFSLGHCGVCPSLTASGYPFGIFQIVLQFVDNIIIIKTKVPFPKEYVTVAYFGYAIWAHWFSFTKRKPLNEE